ncbi:hypothetical protein GIB67_040222 [Kingdonia uniflora]|uniref:DUF8039 domain-containing protein n=1 Tax=Kingdonia uniflora TaxID=39325 RepID=A0A7J7MVI9_9MAGN|nr:hypothetical protein GIB67_040222 [Kingdonia uniflora]
MGQDGEKTNVYFNERGQPIDQGSEKLPSYLGTIGRQMVPITYDDWRDVKGVRKDLIWEAIKAKSKKFKRMRSKQVLPYTASRKGYARVENDMKKISDNPSSIVRVDIWAKAHTKVNGEPSNEEVAKNLAKIQALKNSAPLNSIPLPLKEDMLSQLLGPERHGQARSVVDDEVLQAQTSTPQVQRKRKAKDSVCMLLHLRSRLVVAHGQLVSDDPKCIMHNKVLGPYAVKVSVTMAILPATPLWRLTDDADTIGEALNGFIAWPKDREDVDFKFQRRSKGDYTSLLGLSDKHPESGVRGSWQDKKDSLPRDTLACGTFFLALVLNG